MQYNTIYRISGWPFAAAIAATISACMGASEPNRPNILLAIADDWSYGHAGAYGCTWVKTPAFDRVAREGILFTNAYTPNGKCAPSRSCLLTGRNPWQLKAACNHVPFFPPEFKTYAEALSEHGYFVGKTAKGWAPGVAKDASGKERSMAGKSFDQRKTQPPARGISATDYAGNFEDFLNASSQGKPWCFWYGSTEPHRAYEYGTGVAKGGKHLTDVNAVPGMWPDNEVVRNDMLDYAFEVEYFDLHLQRMLDLLSKRGLLDNTLVVVTSDNGMPFPRAKGQAYDASDHMPLAIMWKKGIAAPGRVVTDYVSFIDFAPTFIGLAEVGWDQTGMAPGTGRSLIDIFRSTQAGRVIQARDHVLIGRERTDVGRPHDWGYPIRGIVKDRMMYLRNFETSRWPGGNPETGYLDCDGSPTKTEVLKTRTDPNQRRYWESCFAKRGTEELYDLSKDPDCLRNLADRAEYRSVKESLGKLLVDALTRENDPRMAGQGGVYEAYPYSGEADRGFYERYMGGEKMNPGWVNKSDFEAGPLD